MDWKNLGRRIAGVMAGGDGGDGELGRDDILTQACAGVGDLGRFGALGQRAFPPSVSIVVTVAEGSLSTVRAFVDDPSLDRELDARLQNRFPDAAGRFPLRAWRVATGGVAGVAVQEAAPAALRLRVAGGDRDGLVFDVSGTRRLVHAGRGPWHGPGDHLRNDLVLGDSLPWLRRQAFRLERRGGSLALHPASSEDELEVVTRDGDRIRPARVPANMVEVKVGDVIEVAGPDGKVVRVAIEAGGEQ